MGGLADGSSRLVCWAVAVLCEYVSPMFGFALPGLGRSHSTDWRSAEGGHLAERCQAFVMLAIGESVVVTGGTLSDVASWSGPIVAAFLVCFAGSLAMWWIYFDWGSRAGSHAIARSREPGLMGAYFHYVHVILVAGIIGSAAADDLVILHPDARIGAPTALLLIGGPALYVFGNGLYKRAIHGWLPLSHWIGLGLSALIAPFAFRANLLTAGALTTLMMIVVAAWESVSLRHARGSRELSVE